MYSLETTKKSEICEPPISGDESSCIPRVTNLSPWEASMGFTEEADGIYGIMEWYHCNGMNLRIFYMSLSTRLQRATTALSLIKAKLSKTVDSDRFWCDHASVEDENEAMCPCCRRFPRWEISTNHAMVHVPGLEGKQFRWEWTPLFSLWTLSVSFSECELTCQQLKPQTHLSPTFSEESLIRYPSLKK